MFTCGDVRVVQQPSLTVAAWNVQRGARVEEIALRLRLNLIDVALLNECDIGMARSGNRDTVADIAAQSGMGHAFAVEFRELGLGNEDERRRLAGQVNRVGLHGNAILARRRMRHTCRIALDDGAVWRESDQPRAGGRMALASEIAGIWFVSAHLESRCDGPSRGQAMRHLIDVLDSLQARRCVLGGDFNTKTAVEPLFEIADRAGFKWRGGNRDIGRFRGRRLDWFFYRDVAVRDPRTHDATGIADHDLITLDVSLA